MLKLRGSPDAMTSLIWGQQKAPIYTSMLCDTGEILDRFRFINAVLAGALGKNGLHALTVRINASAIDRTYRGPP